MIKNNNIPENKSSNNKKALFLIMLGTIILFFIFAFLKSGLFLDEIYTFGLSNSHESGFIKAKMDGDVREKIITREIFEDYLSVQPDEKFDFVSVYHNQEKDVHPPLYYWLFNILYSFFPNSYSRWPAHLMNLTFHLITVLILSKLLNRLFSSKISFLCTALYAFSSISISTALMIRMYVLLTTLTISLAYLILDILENPKWYDYILLTINIYLGLMTQYFFVFYAFFVCLTCLIYFLLKKQYKLACTFSISALLGVIFMVLSFPAVINHLIGDGLVSGTTAVSNALDIKGYLKSILIFGATTFVRLPIAIILGSICLIISFSNHFDKTTDNEKKINRTRSVLIFLPAIISFFIIAIVSPYKTSRYIWNIVPIFIVCLAFVIDTSKLMEKHFNLIPYLLLATFIFDIVFKPEYLMPDTKTIEESLKNYTNLPCVLIQPNGNPQITANMMQLMEFDNILVTDNTESENIQLYLDNNENCIICINTRIDDHIIIAEEVLKSFNNLYEFNNSSLLTKSPFYDIYYLSK